MGESVRGTNRLKAQIEAVRDCGAVNMLDRRGVQRIANDHNFYELVVFCEDKHAYAQAIFYGIDVENPEIDADYAPVITDSDDEDDEYDHSDLVCPECGSPIDPEGVFLWTARGEMHDECFQDYVDRGNTTSHW